MWTVIRAIERLSKVFGYIGAWIIAPLIVSMVWEVISRRFFDAPTMWAYEMSYMLMGTSFIFGLAYTLKMRRHVRVDFLYDHVSLKKQSMIDLVGFAFLVLPALILLLVGLWDFLAYAYEREPAFGRVGLEPGGLALPGRLRHRLCPAAASDHLRDPEVHSRPHGPSRAAASGIGLAGAALTTR